MYMVTYHCDLQQKREEKEVNKVSHYIIIIFSYQDQ